MYGEILALVMGLFLTTMAILDTGDFKKHGPRKLYIVFLLCWLAGFMFGRGI